MFLFINSIAGQTLLEIEKLVLSTIKSVDIFIFVILCHDEII